MGYLLKRTDQPGKAQYVAPPGSPQSYVTRAKARVFTRRAEAEAERCVENEIVLSE